MVVTARAALLALVVVATASCATDAGAVSFVPALPLVREGGTLDARALASDATLTVFVFFSPDCHCLRQHEARLRDLDATFRARGVQFFMVDSEVRASIERDAEEARRRAYTFPILVDCGARLADAVGAEYAAYAVIVDRSGRLRYRGGVDSDKDHLHADATPYLRDALDDLLAGRDPRVANAKTLGCALQKW